MSLISPPPTGEPFDDANGQPSRPWYEWTINIFRSARKYRGVGTTAGRPVNGLEVGDWYYDTTLGYPVWVHQISPSIIWHNGAGASV